MEEMKVVVKDVDIPFWRMVRIMVKWMIAAIPALIILWIIGMIFVAGFMGLTFYING